MAPAAGKRAAPTTQPSKGAASKAPRVTKKDAAAEAHGSKTDAASKAAHVYTEGPPANEKLIAAVADALTAITNHELFSNIKTAKPREQSNRAVFDKRTFDIAMAVETKGTPTYERAMSLFVLNLTSSMSKQTPIAMSKIDLIKKHFWSGDKVSRLFPYTLSGAVSTGDDMAKKHGAVQLLSPPELIWAPIFAAAELIRSGAGEEELQVFHDAFLCVNISLEKIDNDNERMWRSHQLRETWDELGHAVKLTPLQRLFVVLETRTMLERMLGIPKESTR